MIAERPELAWLLELPEEPNDLVRLPSGEYLLTIDDGVDPPMQVLLESHASSLAGYLEALAQSESSETQRVNYRRGYEAASENVPAGLPTPDRLATAGLAELLAALEALEAALAADLAATAAMEAARLAASGDAPDVVMPSSIGTYRPPGYVSDPRLEFGRGPGYDRSLPAGTSAQFVENACSFHADGLQLRTWWPQQHYQTSAKSQGMRGSCVAFALVSAIESDVAIRTNQWVNLSEQRLYYEMRAVWDRRDFGDGFSLWTAAQRIGAFGVPHEQTWPCNPSWRRVEFEPSDTYGFSCDSWYPYACSETTHQAARVCTGNQSYFCGYVPEPRAGDPGYSLTGATTVWSPVQGNLPIHTLRAGLDAGSPMVVALTADTAFKSPTPSGFVGGASSVVKAGHAVHLVGFVSDHETLRLPDIPTDLLTRTIASGGGFFILKNSWGCGGDGGYWYVPVTWAKERFRYIVAFDHGPAPNYGVTPPSITITQPAHNASFPASPFLDITFTAEVSDARDSDACCDVQWRSSVDGPLGSGTSITASFATAAPGQRIVTATATNAAGMQRSAFVTVNLTVQGPNVSIVSPPKQPTATTLYRGLATSFAAEEFAPVTGGATVQLVHVDEPARR